mgnify:CR=1 FL=1
MNGTVSHWIKQPECIVYLEAYEKVGDGIVDAYIDFRQAKDMVLFGRVIGFENQKASFVELIGLKSSKRLRRGCYYKLNLDLLREFKIERREDSLLIGASYNLNQMPMPMDDESELLQTHEALDPEEMSEISLPMGRVFDIVEYDDLRLYVKDVGQANWNELRNGDHIVVVYDAGARLRAKEPEVRGIVESRKNDLMKSKPVLVLSHWDMDHIHCLKVLSDKEIMDCFSKLVCTDKLKSITSQVVFENFKRVLGGNNVYRLPLPGRTTGTAMHQWRREGCITLYQGESSSQINYCGLVMFVRGANRSANYTGDCKLAQAKDVYDQEKAMGLDTGEHVLIAPHHGGDYDAGSRHYSMPCNLIEISVGADNSYGHPHAYMLAYLKSMGVVKQTQDVGDIVEQL